MKNDNIEFETINSNKKRIAFFIGVVFVVILLVTLVLNFTRAKYRSTASVPIVDSEVNYVRPDLNVVAIYVGGMEVDRLDESKQYTLDTTNSTCTYKDGSTIEELNISYEAETGSLSISPFTTKGTKCTLYFNEDASPVINDVTLSSTHNSITVTVDASDDHGIANYYYRINNGSYVSSSNNSYTFSGLTASTQYTIDIYVMDTNGNTSEVSSDIISTQSPPRTIQEILAGYNKSTRSDFSTTMTSSTTDTVYQTIDWDGTTYYFAGNPTDNYIYFAGYYWRIIRVNGDGSIRLIYQGTWANASGTNAQLSSSTFNAAAFTASYHVGLSYDETQHGTGTSSTILTVLNNWYNRLSSANQNYIDSNAGFCSDREMASGYIWSAKPSSTINYVAYERLYTNKSPSLSCSSSDILNIPVGLVTSDEIAYAGGVYNINNARYYLYTGEEYWTMTPYDYTSRSNIARLFGVGSNGHLTYLGQNASNGVRPVINLKSTTKFTGSGTSDDPYTVVYN